MATNAGIATITFGNDARSAIYETQKVITDSNPSPHEWRAIFARPGSGSYFYDIETNGAGTWVALLNGSNDISLSTDNGNSWNIITMPTGGFWTSIRWGGDRFMATCASSRAVAYSTDGSNWTEQANGLPQAGNWQAVAYNGSGVWFAHNSTAATQGAYSTNGGETWTAVTTASITSGSKSRIAGGNGVFILFTSNQLNWRSTDGGQTWTSNQIAQGSNNGRSVHYGGGGRFWNATNMTSINYTDDNGVTWTNIVPQVSVGATNLDTLGLGGGNFMMGTSFEASNPAEPTQISRDGCQSFTPIWKPRFVAVYQPQYSQGRWIGRSGVSGTNGVLYVWDVPIRTTSTVTQTTSLAKAKVGSNEARITITSQTGITSTSAIEVFMMGSDSTSSHNTIEHQLSNIKLSIENIVVGVGFDIVATSTERLTGDFKVRYVWST